MQTEPGTLSLCGNGGLSLTIAEETYQLTRDDIHTLLFYGQSVPLTRTEETANTDGAIIVTTVIDGHITVQSSGWMMTGRRKRRGNEVYSTRIVCHPMRRGGTGQHMNN